MAATALLWGAGFVASKVVAENCQSLLAWSCVSPSAGHPQPMAWFTERGGFIPAGKTPRPGLLGLSGLAANNGFLLLGLKLPRLRRPPHRRRNPMATPCPPVLKERLSSAVARHPHLLYGRPPCPGMGQNWGGGLQSVLPGFRAVVGCLFGGWAAGEGYLPVDRNAVGDLFGLLWCPPFVPGGARPGPHPPGSLAGRRPSRPSVIGPLFSCGTTAQSHRR